MKLWQKQNQQTNRQIIEFTVGNEYILDQNLVKYDCFGSIAHAKMLLKIGILNENEFSQIKEVLKEIIVLDKEKKFIIKQQDEDVHTAIENYLTEKLGKTGGKIHTARSRNDQVLTDLRLYSRDKLIEIKKSILVFCQNLLEFSKNYKFVPMCGYTHTQRAMLSSVGLWSSAILESLLDDLKIVNTSYILNNQSPLGSAAGYGVNLNIDRIYTAQLLGFEKVQNNVIYVQNSRGKIEANICNAIVQIMATLNKFASDLILFGTKEFGFFEIPKDLCTGSSIMPQKNNPDCLELVRAKTSVVESNLFRILNIVKNLPSGYNRDFQETKKPLIESFEEVLSCLNICNLTIKSLKINKAKLKQAITKEIFAADIAIEEAKKGVAFRDAYKKIALDLEQIDNKNFDYEDMLKNKKHIGASGNLQLKNIEKEIKNEKKYLKKQEISNNEVVKKLFF